MNPAIHHGLDSADLDYNAWYIYIIYIKGIMQ